MESFDLCLNDIVELNLTQEGIDYIIDMNIKAAKAFKEATGNDCPAPLYNLSNGKLRTTLWEAMVLLAPKLRQSNKPVVIGNLIKILRGE